MMKNVGNADRVTRIVLALILGLMWLNGTIAGFLGGALAILAIVFLVTGAIGFCPIYFALKLSTLKKKTGA